MTRPRRVVGVVGTGTEVGKTFVVAAIATELRRRGHTVSARKPVQSFDPADPAPTDSQVLAAATGEDPDDVCASYRSLPVPMAPPMAADVLGLPAPGLAELAAVTWPAEQVEVGLLETVGGVRSPVAPDGDSLALVQAADVDLVVLVADASLGTIDRTRLAADAIGSPDIVVVLNRYDPDDPLHDRNRRWLVEVDGFDVVVHVGDLAVRLGSNRKPG